MALPSESSSVHLTFDDGPDPVWTPRVLAALAGTQARATFFVLAGRAVEHSESIAAMQAAGHGVELHGLAHLRHPDCTRATVAADTDRALEGLAALDVTPTRWRLPWGQAADFSHALARERGLEIVGWSADTHDWRGDDASTMAAATLAPGAVVLCHDGIGPGALRSGCEETVRYIELASAWAKTHGCRLEALPTARRAARVPA